MSPRVPGPRATGTAPGSRERATLPTSGTRAGTDSKLPETVGHDRPVVEREIREGSNAPPAGFARVRTCPGTHHLAGNQEGDADRVTPGIPLRVRVHTQEPFHVPQEPGLLGQLADRGLLDGFADFDEPARKCPPASEGGVAAPY